MKIKQALSSFRKVFRIVFVLLFLYLLKDIFFRWDGFKFYGSFSEFLPGVALISILWTLSAFIAAFAVWLPFKAIEGVASRLNRKVTTDHLLAVILLFLLLALIKQYVLPDTFVTLKLMAAVMLGILAAAIFITWLLGNNVERVLNFIQERITPLIWLFAAWSVVSVPIVIYHTWIKGQEKPLEIQVAQDISINKKRPNIILVTFDALAARDMSVYGYERPTTPFIKEWAGSASLFTRAEAESNYTTPTTASLMTGKRIWTHRTYHLEGSKPVNSGTENLALLLKKNGYYNMAFIVNPVASTETLGLSQSFDINFRGKGSFHGIIDSTLHDLFGDKIKLYDWLIKQDFIFYKLLRNFSKDFSETRTPPDRAFNKFLETLDNVPEQPFFVWIHLFPPHLPYLPPAPYMGMFDGSSKLRSFKTQMKARVTAYKDVKKGAFSKELQPMVDKLRARYDEYIRYCDKQFEDFIAQLGKRHRLENTVVILSADHGESFEHATLEHIGERLYESVTNIPLVIKEPGQSSGIIISEAVEQIDIPVTILSLAGIQKPEWMEGRSLAPLMKGENTPAVPVFSMYFERNPSRGNQKLTKGTIAVWDGEYKLIHYLQRKESLLFNLRNDPAEMKNIFNEEPETGRRLLALIEENLRKANDKILQEN